MNNLLIFAGTTEGRLLAEAVSRHPAEGRGCFVCVATEYGKHMLPEEDKNLTVLARRLLPEEMRELMEREKISRVIDATHPYAALASANIRTAADKAGVPYTRLLRESASTEGHIVVPHVKGAVDFLKAHKGKALLTTGSRDLAAFTEIQDFQNQLYPRILPAPEMVKKAFDLGFDTGHLICMQGPFSHEINTAMLRQTGAEYLVTKESGKAGGFAEKLSAAKETGAKVIIIGRPEKEEGLPLEEVMRLCGITEDTSGEETLNPDRTLKEKQEGTEKKEIWFPQFINISGKKILIAGGGKIASRRINTLSLFDAELTVVAPELSRQVLNLEGQGVLIRKRAFEEQDLEGMDMVLAATDDRELNKRIGILCRERNIPVNVADRKEACDFYFPGIVQKGELIIGITAGGRNHSLTVKGKKLIEEALEKGLEE
ncbi:precorrin-6A reductase [bacterium 210820-DFI.6.37]|nr:precorrin-6A reductase [bacterium 210820-DFI.6.37]